MVLMCEQNQPVETNTYPSTWYTDNHFICQLQGLNLPYRGVGSESTPVPVRLFNPYANDGHSLSTVWPGSIIFFPLVFQEIFWLACTYKVHTACTRALSVCLAFNENVWFVFVEDTQLGSGDLATTANMPTPEIEPGTKL